MKARRLVGLSLLFLVTSASAGFAAVVPGTVGYDISFPQCGGAFPTGGAFGLVGVNGGLPFSPNPCLGAGSGPSELAWAGSTVELYANTADPGPLRSSHWPNGQTAPKPCNTPDSSGADALECHYDYGWNAAADSYATAVDAFVSLGQAIAGATTTPMPTAWWLDVEAANSWTTDPARNIAALQGEVDYLRSAGVVQVGIYSSPADWASITGKTLLFAGLPAWVPGAATGQQAQSRCTGPGSSGGPIQLVQFPLSGFTADYACPIAPPSVSFAGLSKRLVAGMRSTPLAVVASSSAANALSVTLTSDSAAGRFSTTPEGPWSTALTVSIEQGQARSGTFFYRDTRAGTTTLHASGPGITPSTQAVAIVAAQAARIIVSPMRATLRVGRSRAFTARINDAYGNRVSSVPSWTVRMARVASLAPPTNGVSVRVHALAPGRATVQARAGRAVGSATLLVRR